MAMPPASAMPSMRAAKGGRIIQLSSYGGQVAFPGNSMYHATKWGIEGFFEATAQDIAPFNVQVTLIEPGGARTSIFSPGTVIHGQAMPE